MKILYNPPSGKPIGEGYNDFVYQGTLVESHIPGQLKQYPDTMADELKEVFVFLEEVTPTQAKKILEAPKEGKYKCEYCIFQTDVALALRGHMRKHAKEIAVKNEPIIDPNIVPVSSSSKKAVEVGGAVIAEKNFTSGLEKEEIPNGTDKDGVGWYGEGTKEEKGSMEATKPFNQGHFGGQTLIE